MSCKSTCRLLTFVACLSFFVIGLFDVFGAASTESIDTILNKNWAHVKIHKTEDDYPALITTLDQTHAIPYAFSDREDIDLDGKTYYEPPNKVTEFEVLVVSESASYALLRALWMNDKETFDRVWNWTASNLQHKNISEVFDWKTKKWTDPESLGLVKDYLFAWRWVPTVYGDKGGDKDGIIVAKERDDRGVKGSVWVDGWGFASDADQDIALALIFADSRWGSRTGIFDYASQARNILADLWKYGTYIVCSKRFLNGGTGAFNNIEPGYLSPFSYRVFEDFDPDHSWNDLVATSYEVFKQTAEMTLKNSCEGENSNCLNGGSGEDSRLLPDWVAILPDGSFANSNMRNEPEFGTDAFRAYWRIAVDYAWFKSKAKDAFRILKDIGEGPHNFIEAKFDEDWSKTTYNERGKLPRIMAHNGGYLLNETTGASVETSDTGSRADAGSYAVWLSYFGATRDSTITQKLLDPLVRYDRNPETSNDEQGYEYGVDGWLVKDKESDGIYWKFHDHSDWRADYDYYNNTWAWLGLALYKKGYIVNYYKNPNSKPAKIISIKLKNSSDDDDYVFEIDDTNMTVEVQGTDGNHKKVDFVYVSIKSSDERKFPKTCGPINVKCSETAKDSGVYRGNFVISAFSNDAKDEIGGQTGSRITFKVGTKTYTASISEISFGNKTLVDACNHDCKMSNAFGGYWYPALDTNDGHYSTGTMTFPAEGISGNCAKFEYKLNWNEDKDKNTVFAILGTQMPSNGTNTTNLNDYTGISLYLRGNGKPMSFVLVSNNVTDYNYYQYLIDATPGEWRQYVLRFENFSQESWGRQVDRKECLGNVTDLHFKANSKVDNEVGWFEIDNIILIGTPYTCDEERCVLQGTLSGGHSLENYTWAVSGDSGNNIPTPTVVNTTECMEGNGATSISSSISQSSNSKFWWLGVLAPTDWGKPAVTDWLGWDGVSFQIKLPNAFEEGKAIPRIRLEARDSNNVEGGKTKWYSAALTESGFRIHVPKTAFYNDPEHESDTWNGNWGNLASFRIHYGSSEEKGVPNAVIVDDIRLYKKK